MEEGQSNLLNTLKVVRGYMGRHPPPANISLLGLAEGRLAAARDVAVSSASVFLAVLAGNPTTAVTHRHTTTNTFIWREWRLVSM